VSEHLEEDQRKPRKKEEGDGALKEGILL